MKYRVINNIKFYLWGIGIICMLNGCAWMFDDDTSRPLLTEKVNNFIVVGLSVNAVSVDSIIVKVKFTNNSDKPFVFYKPLLPYDDFTENNFGMLEASTSNPVKFLNTKKEKYLEDNHGELMPGHIIPVIKKDNLIELSAKDSLVIENNIAGKFDFKPYLSKGKNEFLISFGISTPFVVNGKQQTELDTIINTKKPVYHFILYGNLYDDYDAKVVKFKIPSSP